MLRKIVSKGLGPAVLPLLRQASFVIAIFLSLFLLLAWPTLAYAVPQPPTVSTQVASGIEETTATGNGNITDTGGDDCTERGFKYGLTETETWSVSETGTFGAGAYGLAIPSLSPGTTYYFKAFAINGFGPGQGGYIGFTTKPDPPTALNDTGSTITSTDLSWTKGAGATNTMIRYRTDDYPTSPSDGTEAYYGINVSCTVSSLNSGQLYYFRAWSYTADYSDEYASLTASTLSEVGGILTGSSGHDRNKAWYKPWSACGLLGLEALLFLFIIGFLRRRKRYS